MNRKSVPKSLLGNHLPSPNYLSIEPLAVDLDGVRQLLGTPISDVTIWRLEKKGFLQRVPGIRNRLFTVKSIREFVEDKAQRNSTNSK